MTPVVIEGRRREPEPVSVIDAELRRIAVARRAKARRTQRRHIERLIDYVWFDGPEGAA